MQDILHFISIWDSGKKKYMLEIVVSSLLLIMDLILTKEKDKRRGEGMGD
jgi:hypothetical protein